MLRYMIEIASKTRQDCGTSRSIKNLEHPYPMGYKTLGVSVINVNVKGDFEIYPKT